MNEATLRRMRKLLALAQRGVGGEKDTAQRMLDKMLSRHKMTIDDLNVDARKEYRITLTKMEHRTILFQVLYKVLNVDSIQYKHRPKYREVCVELTPAEYVETMEMFKQLTRQWDKEQERLMVAFVGKHELYSDQPAKGERKFTQEELEAIYRMMAGMDDVELRKGRLIDHHV